MQPHFIYNTLGSIQEIMHEDPEYASRLLGDFSIHLRSCIRAMSGDKPIPFEQELNNIRAYMNIEKMRFAEKLRFEYDIQTKDFYVLPLSVQPIVENAIRHGIYGRGPAGGTVKLSTRKDDDSFVVEVEDDGIGFDVSEICSKENSDEGEHTGLRNTIFRLGAVMDGTVNIQSEAGKGTKVTIRLPAERSGL
jgi:sensor histidine kinase YesM